MELQPLKPTEASFQESALQKLKEHRHIWDQNPVLQEQYATYYRRLLKWLPESHSKVVELGGGIGNFKSYHPQTWVTDIVPSPWINMTLDAQQMPFSDSSLDAIVMIDVLHHLASPTTFFEETQRVLRPGGRLLIIEPYPARLSYWVYKNFHDEPVDFDADVWHSKTAQESLEKDPWEGNQAMALQFFWRQQERFEKQFPQLKICVKEAFDWSAPLSGGFSYRALIPKKCSHWLEPLGRWKAMNALCAFRCFIALENRH